LLLLFFALPASATNRYVTETGSTSGACTSGVISRSTFNGTSLSPDDVVLFCGTIAGEVDPQSSGTSGHPIILRFDTGAKFSVTGVPGFSQFVYLDGLGYITIDGGTPCGSPALTCNGQIQYLNVGTAFGSTDYPRVISVNSGTHDLEIKNMELGPFFIHTAQGGNYPTLYDQHTVVYGNNPGVNIHIHDSKLHDSGWVINLFGSAGTSMNYEIDHNYFHNISHGVNLGTNGATSFGGLKFHDNIITDPANWDQTSGSFHHDGLQITCVNTPCTVTNVWIYNNTFGGDWGSTSTSPIFLEVHEGSSFFDTNIVVFNNLFQNTNTSNGWSNGINLLGHSGVLAYNNTVICSSFGGIGLQVGGSSTDSRNNVVTGCQMETGTGNETTSFAALNYNLYANWITGGGGNAFSYNGSNTSGANLAAHFSNWKTLVGGGFEGNSVTAASAGLDSFGVPQAGGAVATMSGTNLTSLCATYPPLCSDKNGNARPGGATAWTPGAFVVGGSGPPTPPTGVSVIVVGP
jgi:hypothetical protein